MNCPDSDRSYDQGDAEINAATIDNIQLLVREGFLPYLPR